MFTKGQRVTLIRNWNAYGMFTITPAVVYSCGKKLMVLTNENTGEELGRHFLPSRQQHNFGLVVDPSEDAEAIALEQAAKLIASEIARYEGIIANPNCRAVGGGSYIETIERYLADARTFQPSVREG